jgi:hypothetical protein
MGTLAVLDAIGEEGAVCPKDTFEGTISEQSASLAMAILTLQDRTELERLEAIASKVGEIQAEFDNALEHHRFIEAALSVQHLRNELQDGQGISRSILKMVAPYDFVGHNISL